VGIGVVFEFTGLFVFQEVLEIDVKVVHLVLARIHLFSDFVFTTRDVVLPFGEEGQFVVAVERTNKDVIVGHN
jgi:hypothetical protein